MAVSIKEVAKTAGVSTATVSHVINQTRYVSAATKRKVLVAMEALNYYPNQVARSLRSNKSNMVALIYPVGWSDTSTFFFASVTQGVQNKLKEHGYHLITSNISENVHDEMEQVKALNSLLIEGIIIAPTPDDHSYLNETASGRYPIIFIDRKPVGYDADSVLVDGKSITNEAVNYLINKGHKEIGFINGHLGITTSDERLLGYKNALLKNNIEIDESLIKIAEVGKTSFETGYKLTKELLKVKGVTALFVANNVMSMGAMAYIQETKIKVPDELAIIGFDDYDWTKISTPPLTVIMQPAYEMGEKAAEVLLDRIKNPNREIREYRLSAKLIMRGSC
jgi:LacI family transcriptional regulator